MNRKGHVSLGAAIGVGTTALQPAPTLSGVLLAGWVTGAAALLPDLDHPNSTATDRFGPVSRVLSVLLRGLSASLYKITKGPRDEPVRGAHRHATHTLAFAGLVGWGVTAGCRAAAEHDLWAGIAAVLVVVAILVDLAVTFFGWWMLPALGVLAGTIVSSGQPVMEILQLAEPVGWYVAIGCGAHCAGDAFTKHGCPLLWPIPFKGETFYEWRLPGPLRITTGGAVERLLVGTFTTAACLIGVYVLNPGVASQLLSLNSAAVVPVSLELLDSRSTPGRSRRRTSEHGGQHQPRPAPRRCRRDAAEVPPATSD